MAQVGQDVGFPIWVPDGTEEADDKALFTTLANSVVERFVQIYESTKAPVFFLGRFRRSDGSRIVNSGSTAFRWEGSPTLPTGYVTGSDANGMFVQVPKAGTYRIVATLQYDINAAHWLGLGIRTDGATVVELIPGEESGSPGFGTVAASAVVYFPNTSVKIWFSLGSNASGTMRDDGRVSIYRVPSIQ